MQRLVYSPSVSAYIQTETGILDVSDYITSGSVNRVLNEVSTAELTLRNPDKRFTKPGDPTFRPMDGITIFASRYRSKPVQIFTGYLDSTPYLQLFPGTCTIRASCTLKRLLHTYWDAGLPHTIQFLSKFGWYPNPQTGTIFSQIGQTQASGIKPGDSVSEQEVRNAIITDGSVGNLLWNVLFEIGNWDKNHIYIEKLPKDTIKTVADIMKTFEKDDDETEKELQNFLKDLIGDYTPGSDLGGPSPGLRGNENAEKVFNYFVDRGFTDEGAAGVVGNFMRESGCNPAITEGGSGIGYGLAQWSYTRRTQLEQFAHSQGKPPSDMKVQLDFAWKELQAYGSLRGFLSGTHNVDQATIRFCNEYERPGVVAMSERIAFAKDALAAYGGQGVLGDNERRQQGR